MQSKRSYEQNERNDETKIKSLAMMVSGVHLHGKDKKEVQVQGVKQKKQSTKRFTLARQSTLA